MSARKADEKDIGGSRTLQMSKGYDSCVSCKYSLKMIPTEVKLDKSSE